jgi:DNA-binding response OmpR family regulator
MGSVKRLEGIARLASELAEGGYMTKHVLIVSSESSRGDVLAGVSRYGGLRPTLCTTVDDARDLLARKRFAAVLCEDILPDGCFQDVITCRARSAASTPVIVVSRRDDWESYIMALSAGASDYLAFPPYPGEVEQALEKLGKLSPEFATAA